MSVAIKQADDAFAAAMARATGRPIAAVPKAPPRQASASEISLGAAETGGDVFLDVAKLMEGRALVQGVSGAGKSWTLRRILEQSAGMVQQIIIDPEGEFRSLAEHLGHLHVDGQQLDGAAIAMLGHRVREHRLSIVLDISDLSREDQMSAVAAFCHALIEAPREFWSPALVAIDEAHLFAPFGGQAAASSAVRKAAIGAVTDLMSRGRKRGLAGILATQRLARLAKSVVSEVQNFLIGGNTLDLDVRRAAETIGWEARKAFDRLPLLLPGNFVAVGPAFSRSPAILGVGQVASHHAGAAPALAAPRNLDADQARALVDIDELIAASAETLDSAESPSLRAVRMFLRDPACCTAARVFDALTPLYPEGATLDGLAAHLGLSRSDVCTGVALLDSVAAIELRDDAVRLARGMERKP